VSRRDFTRRLGLGRLKHSAAIEPIRRRLDDPAFDVRQHTCDALAELCAETALPKLRELGAQDPHESVKKAAGAAVTKITEASLSKP
jgi:HEAT repeat protein